MKLLRFGNINNERTGVLIDDIRYDTTSFGEDYDENFFEKDGVKRLQLFIEENRDRLPVVKKDVRIATPVARPSKIVCIGLNYADHAKETGTPIPTEPVIFMKATTSFTGPFDNIIIPKNSVKTDWEVELAVVIGKRASYITEATALDHVAGFTVHNDVSERAFQLERNGTWDKGKGCDTFAPIGPYLVTPDEINDIDNLRLWLTVNGKRMQDGTTANLIFKIPFLISYVSQFMTLLPGDIISTGTPAGVGMGFKPAIYLKENDVVELGIEGIGISKQNVKAWRENG